jgi:hypothetical protein
LNQQHECVTVEVFHRPIISCIALSMGGTIKPGLFMNTYYSGRSSHPAGLFSFGLLDGPQSIAVSRNGRLHLGGAYKRGALYSSRRAPCEKPKGKGRVPLCERLSWQAQGGRVNTGMDGVSARLGRWENRGFGLSRFVGDIHE